MHFTLSLAEYKMLHPDTAEIPTLSQNGMLAVLLQKRRFRLACISHRQAKHRAWREAMCTWFGRWRTRLRGSATPQANPAFAAAGARNL